MVLFPYTYMLLKFMLWSLGEGCDVAPGVQGATLRFAGSPTRACSAAHLLPLGNILCSGSKVEAFTSSLDLHIPWVFTPIFISP